MIETVKGLILRETPIGEYDKIMTVLTASHGKISVFARGAKRLKSPLFTPTQLFSYSEMTLYKSTNTYYMRQGALVESFYHIRDTLEGTALAGYLADIAADIALEEQAEETLLRLTLNSFYAIAEKVKPVEQIKAVFELRAVSEAGFRPNLVACDGCGRSDMETYYFDVTNGIFYCENCFRTSQTALEHSAARQNEADSIYHTGQLIALLSSSVFAAMRYAVYAKLERIFAFELKEEALRDFASVCEKYLLCHLEHGFSTLDFYHSITPSLSPN